MPRSISQRHHRSRPRSYVVIENTPGYLPDTPPARFRSKVDAEAHANELVRQLREEGYTKWGSVKKGYVEMADRKNKHGLPRVIEIVERNPSDQEAREEF
jgi:hypothetical protein